ncbi:CDP-diacylglycerol--glycerol-3-phosphate 3-phosphatidyltransferase [Lolliginicoccus levis]|uniref:CDP-diacylglycerol--glycerol-3-phosphate 3-phosphatidyltransferase n=1 Tax=Lolliginicoccus levis TaxID=2919542 RepID=UPI00241CA63C|nr:CDP-diacylglycerol--glycerol-3-phosphate 3-phosphatidyltransferase [Lolliginicoccus levis]
MANSDDRGIPGHADGVTEPVPVLNVANVLTVLRILIVPVFLVALLIADGESTVWRITAGALFILAAVTDRYDGHLARKHGLITDFGKIADPIADKALMGSALIGLSILGDLSWWITGIILFRELGITLLRFWVIRHGVMPAGRGGKLKTVIQIVAICFFIFPLPGWVFPISATLMAAAVIITVATGVDYVVQALRLRRDGRASQANR